LEVGAKRQASGFLDYEQAGNRNDPVQFTPHFRPRNFAVQLMKSPDRDQLTELRTNVGLLRCKRPFTIL
jgi:hypothetical protein